MFKTKKLNNKGVTLVELIVSFALVSIAIIYFYQTLTTVTKMYANAKKDTKKVADENYALRLVNEYLDSAHSFIIDIESYNGSESPDILRLEKNTAITFEECFNDWDLKEGTNAPDGNDLLPRAINVNDDTLFTDVSLNGNDSAKEYLFTDEYIESTDDLNPRIIQEVLYYMNYSLEVKNGASGVPYSDNYHQQFSTWNCTYNTSNPMSKGNCLFLENDKISQSALYLSSIGQKKEYFISYIVNSELDDSANVYNYKNGCFKTITYNGASYNIDELDVWIPIRIQNSNLNDIEFKEKFKISSDSISYNPMKKLIKWEIEYNDIKSIYYKFYDQNQHDVIYYSSWMFKEPNKPKEFTAFRANLN